MAYKTGQEPQKNDEVLGEVDGKPARGRVLAVREDGRVLVTRRAAYAGPGEPLKHEHHEVPADGLVLIYRPRAQGMAAPAPALPAAKARAKKEAAKK